MADLLFGPPVGGVFQVAYTVPDIHKAMAEWGERLKIGPWYLMDYNATPNARYRGAPTNLHIAITSCFSGSLHIELFQLLDDGPSVYHEYVKKRGHGFHHWAIGSKSFDADVERYKKLGYELAFFEHHARGRVAYMDTSCDLPGMIEICEMTERQEQRLAKMQQSSIGYDGTNPVREAPT